MQEKKKDKSGTENLLSLKTLFERLKKFFVIWLVAALIIGVLNVGYSFGVKVLTGSVETVVNFSFDGIESGVDPNGNKFDVNSMKSEKLVQAAADELGLEIDAGHILNYISIDGIVPANVISRITNYNSIFASDDIKTSRYIQETTYYPTQYKISIECHEAGLSKKESADLLNKLTEKYYTEFYNTYGYNISLESAVRSIDYNDYDYAEAVDVFSASLGSLQNYIRELASGDKTRFRAENGYTFADISSSIDTVRNEDLEWISSYILLNNVTKDKKTLIENYKFKIEELTRTKAIADDTVKSVDESIEVYEKNAILIYNGSSDGGNAEINRSSETYDNLISQKLSAQSTSASCDQKIKQYEDRIKSLETGKSDKADNEIVEQKFEDISAKIDTLLATANETAAEYYEKYYLGNAYTVIYPAATSFSKTFVSAVKDSMRNIVMFELILTAVYLAVSTVDCFWEIPLISRSGKKSKSKKAKKSK